jgi:acyl-CoA thioester hydrolase
MVTSGKTDDPPAANGTVYAKRGIVQVTEHRTHTARSPTPDTHCGYIGQPMPIHEHTITIRVRYPEVDQMGYLHHSRYVQYLEMGRIELLRALGFSYAELERRGIFFVVVKVDIRYKAPARYDEELTLTTRVEKRTHVRFDHAYELRRGETMLAVATTTIACVDRAGHVIQIPEELRAEEV